MLEVLSPGPTYTLVQNQVYAMPCVKVFVTASAALEFSLNLGSGFASVAGSTTGMVSNWPYVRSTGVATRVDVARD